MRHCSAVAMQTTNAATASNASTRRPTLHTVGVDHCPLRSVAPGDGGRPALALRVVAEGPHCGHTPTQSGGQRPTLPLRVVESGSRPSRTNGNTNDMGGQCASPMVMLGSPCPGLQVASTLARLGATFGRFGALKPALTRPAGDVSKTTVIHSR